MTEKQIQVLLMRYLLNQKGHIFAVPNNISIFNWEADMISLTKSGFFHEFEIKRTLQDYENDFSGSARKEIKHSIMGSSKYNKGANYFWFVTTGFDVSWLPNYAGLIEVRRNGALNILTKAPRIHSEKASMPQLKRGMRSLSYRLFNLLEKE